jgi:hypothetical protein
MKKLLTIVFLLSIQWLYAQSPCNNYCLDFEDTFCQSHLRIDHINYLHNTWQTGQSQKPGFGKDDSFYNNVIITDTMNSYPARNISVFEIRNIASWGDIYGCKMFQASYQVETDSLKDFGKIEFSADRGKTWIDIVNDTNYSSSFKWFSTKPVLSGNSKGWRHFEVWLTDNGSVFNIKLGDTLIYRISFISDSIAENKNGLMFDELCFHDFVEGISEIRFTPIKSKIFPNPSGKMLTIAYENPQSDLFQLAVYDIHSKLMLKRDNVPGNSIQIDAGQFKPGIYVYKLTNMKVPKRSWGKFVIE